MRVVLEESLAEGKLVFDAGSHDAGDNVSIELELLLDGGAESCGDLGGGDGAAGGFVVVAGHG